MVGIKLLPRVAAVLVAVAICCGFGCVADVRADDEDEEIFLDEEEIFLDDDETDDDKTDDDKTDDDKTDDDKTDDEKTDDNKTDDNKTDDDKTDVKPVKSGWKNEKGGTRYYLKGKFLRGLYKINGEMYLFDSNGFILTGRQIFSGKEYTFDANGKFICTHTETNFVDTSDSLYTYKDMASDISSLAKHYPEITRVKIIGTTADNRNIYDVIIGNPNAKKQIVIQAACHAREYMTSLLAMKQLEYYLNGYYNIKYKGMLFKDIFSEYAIHFIPMLNPDGVSISQFGSAGIVNGKLRAGLKKMYINAVKWKYTSLSESEYYRVWKANARGIDLNRNFNGYWSSIDMLNGAGGVGYKGRFPESENESKAITKLIRSLSNPVTVMSYHSTGSVLWWDYGQTGDYRNRCLAQAALISKQTGYKMLEYDKDSAGGLSDWIIEARMKGTIPETIEIGINPCPLNISEFPSIWKKNRLTVISAAYLWI